MPPMYNQRPILLPLQFYCKISHSKLSASVLLIWPKYLAALDKTMFDNLFSSCISSKTDLLVRFLVQETRSDLHQHQVSKAFKRFILAFLEPMPKTHSQKMNIFIIIILVFMLCVDLSIFCKFGYSDACYFNLSLNVEQDPSLVIKGLKYMYIVIYVVIHNLPKFWCRLNCYFYDQQS